MSRLSRIPTSLNRPLSGSGPSIVSLPAAEAEGIGTFRDLPVSLMILAEDSLRHGDLPAAAAIAGSGRDATVEFHPARILMQDSSGIPVLADLAALRDATPEDAAVEPRIPVDLVMDHSVEVDRHGTAEALRANLAIEFERNAERYRFLRWAASAFKRLGVVPPGRGICHQINLEVLASVVSVRDGVARPDTMLGTDSHSTMVNALSVFGWGVGGIEALSAMLGRAVALRIPRVVGVRLRNQLPAGSTATDLALTMTELLRGHGVVGKFVEFYGPGLGALSLPDRATIANMAPEYGATMGFFPIDDEVLAYLRLTGRDAPHVALVESYARTQGLWQTEERRFDETIEFDLSRVEPSLAGPSRPNQRLGLSAVAGTVKVSHSEPPAEPNLPIRDGDIAIAAITSCTNTANTEAMLRAGLLARAARSRGLKVPAWTKTSLAPGSRVVSDYLREAALLEDLAALGFSVVGHGCTTCMGNSGPLEAEVEDAIRRNDLTVAAVLSGNRNFEGRIHPLVRAAYLASPPLVVAYALAGNVRIDLTKEPLGTDVEGRQVMLADLWPDDAAVAAAMAAVKPSHYAARAATTFDGPHAWKQIVPPTGTRFAWQPDSLFIRPPPFATSQMATPLIAGGIAGAQILALLGDDVTTDHISPVSRILPDTEAGQWLMAHGTAADGLQSYSARRVNHEVMARGTFANLRLRNRLVPGREGGFTRLSRDGEVLTIHAAAAALCETGKPIVIVAGRNYGAGSARDWAAKGTRILGVSAVIAESFERIHRANLVALGVLPLQFEAGQGADSLGLSGFESIDILGLDALAPGGRVIARFRKESGDLVEATLLCRIETDLEAADLKGGGVLPVVLRDLLASS
ncbi:aconitate hydratase 1 [Bradyrhizobium sp. STM 3843]|uniref:aconitate hydratase AcnA n=1 Tax=Bradyrhizobium sp. STM 3843 TaxID=551947 RepID=UPI0002403480|nr:aconitate hydratase AcnA [Bradyrhizobium sp. STM 3843]CCE10760.1 aconitate hydratase 1 [Bradyrhizobium sp. STM 3843]